MSHENYKEFDRNGYLHSRLRGYRSSRRKYMMNLIENYDSGAWEVPEDSIAAGWLADNIIEKDAMSWSYEIDDLK